MVDGFINIRIPQDLYDRVRELYASKALDVCIAYIEQGLLDEELQGDSGFFVELPGGFNSIGRSLVVDFYRSGLRRMEVPWRDLYANIYSAAASLNKNYAKKYGVPVKAVQIDGALYLEYTNGTAFKSVVESPQSDVLSAEESTEDESPLPEEIQNFWESVFILFPWMVLHPSAHKLSEPPPIDEKSVRALSTLLVPSRFSVERLISIFIEDATARRDRPYHYHKMLRWWLIEKAAMFDPELRKVTE